MLAIADTELVAADGTRKPSQGSFALEGTERENVAALLEAPIDNSRVYGLFRREALVRAIPDEEFFAMDWAIAIATLREGRHAVAAGATLVRTDSDTEKYLRLIEVYTPPGPGAPRAGCGRSRATCCGACARRCRPVPPSTSCG